MSEDVPLGLLFGLLIVLLLLSAFFSSTETALMSLNRYRLRHRARAGHHAARLTEKLLQRPDRIIGLILLQQGKGADMGASFGAGASQTLFGADGGGNVLTKATAILATAFFVTSFGLAIVAKDRAAAVSEIDLPALVIEQPAVSEETDTPVVDEDLPPTFSGEEEIPEVE